MSIISSPLPPCSPAPSPHSPLPTLENSSPPGLLAEIEALRSNMAWLQDAFERAESLDERLKLSAAWGLASSHLARLVRVQHLLTKDLPTDLDRNLEQVLGELLVEWGRE